MVIAVKNIASCSRHVIVVTVNAVTECPVPCVYNIGSLHRYFSIFSPVNFLSDYD